MSDIENSPASEDATVKKVPVKRVSKSHGVLSEKSLNAMKEALKKYAKITEMAKSRNMNESDTSNIINDLLGEVLGYDKFFDVTTEYKIKGQYADYGVKIDDKLSLIIEVKAMSVKLNENHIFQASSYASTEGVEWVILTNLEEWQVYHLSFGSRIDQELVLSFNLLEEAKSVKLIEKLAYLHKEAIKKWCLSRLWGQKVATSGKNFKKVITSQAVVKVIQRELAKATNTKIGESDILEMLEDLFKDQ